MIGSRVSMSSKTGSSSNNRTATNVPYTRFFAGGPGLANAAIIHHAFKAVSCPANRILHVKVVGVQNGVPIAGETWQETSAPYANRGIKGEVGHQGEAADNGTTTSQYDPRTNTIYEQPDSSSPTFSDPISQVRKELAKGAAEVDGSVVIDGVSLYKISLPNGLVGYFDKNDYMPRYLDDRDPGHPPRFMNPDERTPPLPIDDLRRDAARLRELLEGRIAD